MGRPPNPRPDGATPVRTRRRTREEVGTTIRGRFVVRALQGLNILEGNLGAVGLPGDYPDLKRLRRDLERLAGGPIVGIEPPGEPQARRHRPSELARTAAFRAADAARKRAARAARKASRGLD